MAPGWLEDWVQWNREGSIATLTISCLLPILTPDRSYHPCEVVLPGCKVLKHQIQNYEWLLTGTSEYVFMYTSTGREHRILKTIDGVRLGVIFLSSSFLTVAFVQSIKKEGKSHQSNRWGGGKLGKSPWRTKNIFQIQQPSHLTYGSGD